MDAICKRTDRHIIWGYLQVGEIESIHRSKYCENGNAITLIITIETGKTIRVILPEIH